jgi:hypothetical protein
VLNSCSALNFGRVSSFSRHSASILIFSLSRADLGPVGPDSGPINCCRAATMLGPSNDVYTKRFSIPSSFEYIEFNSYP